jgi:hypothetical protein
VFDTVPDIEDELATRFQDAPRFPIGFLFVGNEHHPELTDHRIECAVGKWQRLRISLLPAHTGRRYPLGGMVEHGLVEVGCNNAGAGR